MTLLLTTDLPIPPSVNHRLAITKHGGHDTPETTAFKWQSRSILYNAEKTYQDHEATAQARKNDDYLRDRKSTRLNSSHQIISYAVFCLKKKKKNREIRKTKINRSSRM